jgi:hypothetical protein
MILGGCFAHATPDQQQLIAALDSNPLYCATINESRRICTWHVERRHHVVCELDPSEQPAGASCSYQEDNSRMLVFPSLGSKGQQGGAGGSSQKRAFRKAARARLEAARTLAQVNGLVGAGPKVCQGEEPLTCTWHAVRRTPGYITLARIANAPGKKIDLICKFTDGGKSREAGACGAHVAGRAPRQ